MYWEWFEGYSMADDKEAPEELTEEEINEIVDEDDDEDDDVDVEDEEPKKAS